MKKSTLLAICIILFITLQARGESQSLSEPTAVAVLPTQSPVNYSNQLASYEAVCPSSDEAFPSDQAKLRGNLQNDRCLLH